MGEHERHNRRWVREAGAGVKQRDPRLAAEWLLDLVEEGELAATAWAGYVRLPRLGLCRILEELRDGPGGDADPRARLQRGTAPDGPASAGVARSSP